MTRWTTTAVCENSRNVQAVVTAASRLVPLLVCGVAPREAFVDPSKRENIYAMALQPYERSPNEQADVARPGLTQPGKRGPGASQSAPGSASKDAAEIFYLAASPKRASDNYFGLAALRGPICRAHNAHSY